MVGQKENQDLDGSKRVYAVKETDVPLEDIINPTTSRRSFIRNSILGLAGLTMMANSGRYSRAQSADVDTRLYWGMSMPELQERIAQQAVGDYGLALAKITPPEYRENIYDLPEEDQEIRIDGKVYPVINGRVMERIRDTDEQTDIRDKGRKPATWADRKVTRASFLKKIAPTLTPDQYRIARFEPGEHKLEFQSDEYYNLGVEDEFKFRVLADGRTRIIPLVERQNEIVAPYGNVLYYDHQVQSIRVEWVDVLKVAMVSGDHRTYTGEFPIGCDYGIPQLENWEKQGKIPSVDLALQIFDQVLLHEMNEKIGLPIFERGQGANPAMHVRYSDNINQGWPMLIITPDPFGEYGWRWDLETTGFEIEPWTLDNSEEFSTVMHEASAHLLYEPADDISFLKPKIDPNDQYKINQLAINALSLAHTSGKELSKLSYFEAFLLRTMIALTPNMKRKAISA